MMLSGSMGTVIYTANLQIISSSTTHVLSLLPFPPSFSLLFSVLNQNSEALNNSKKLVYDYVQDQAIALHMHEIIFILAGFVICAKNL